MEPALFGLLLISLCWSPLPLLQSWLLSALKVLPLRIPQPGVRWSAQRLSNRIPVFTLTLFEALAF